MIANNKKININDRIKMPGIKNKNRKIMARM